jgi:hypothetical protein
MAAIHSSTMVKSVCGMPLQGIMEQGVQSNQTNPSHILRSSLLSSFNLITIVLLALLNILCLLLLVNIHPKMTSSGSKNALPKLSIAVCVWLLVGTAMH